MKKRSIAALVLIASLCVGTTVSAHHGRHHRAAVTPSVSYCTYEDADCDGICDHYSSHCDEYLDADGDGVCDYCQNQGLHTNQGNHDCGTSDNYYHHYESHRGHCHH